MTSVKRLVDPEGLVHVNDSDEDDVSTFTLCERWIGEAYDSDELKRTRALTTCLWCVALPHRRLGEMPPGGTAAWRRVARLQR